MSGALNELRTKRQDIRALAEPVLPQRLGKASEGTDGDTSAHGPANGRLTVNVVTKALTR
jgi:hypothetical protein